MTVVSLINRADYVGNGSVGPYSYAFRIFAATDIEVTTRTTGDVEATLSYPADYSVTGVGVRTGGTITLTVALATGYTLTILRKLPLKQSTEIRNQGPYFASTVEDMADRNIMIQQYYQDVLDRTMTLPVTVSPNATLTTLPVPTANEVLTWNPGATALINTRIDSSGMIGVPGEGRTVPTATGYLANNVDYNVRDYGALGNGVQDDGPYIATAAAAAMAVGGTVRFPQGDYKITTDILVTSAVRVQGEPGSRIVQTVQDKNVFYITGNDVIIDGVVMEGLGGSAGTGVLVNCGIVVDDALRVRILNCTGSNFEGSGIIVYGASADYLIQGNLFYGNIYYAPVDTAADILIYGSPSPRGVITGNRCYSNNSQGIFLNAIEAEDIVVTGNICITMNTAGTAELAAGSVLRRHGILLTYNGGTVGGRLVCANNICKNTLLTGIYAVAGVPTTSPVMIIGNHVKNTGLATVGGISYAGIAVLAQGEGDIIANNIVDGVTLGQGIMVTSNAVNQGGTPTGSTTVIGNTIKNCASTTLAEPALYVGLDAKDVAVIGNMFENNARRDIYVDYNASGNGGNVTIRGNHITKAVAYEAIYVSAGVLTTKVTVIEHNFIDGGGVATIGVAHSNEYVQIRFNTIINCVTGVQSLNNIPSVRSITYPLYDHNAFRSCTNGILCFGGSTTSTLVAQGNTFITCTNRIATGGGNPAAYEGTKVGTSLIIESTVVPAYGTWAVGDEWRDSTPVTGTPSGGVCTVAGAQGTWVSRGVTGLLQAVALADMGALATVETAGGTYTANEQTMLTNVKTDLGTLRTLVNTLLANRRTAFEQVP